MFPEAKLKIINALKEQNEIVAMTGDGVNDGPALKAAHIGIAMGKKGSEIAKDAASLILMNDDLSKMVQAVSVGRKIYTNLKKAIQYIISIHIPIILTVFVPLALGWIYPNIFSPVHVIFLELIMGPTCSIIYENEPIEKNTMKLKPRPLSDTFFNWKELTTSILQGLAITVGTLGTYQICHSPKLNRSHY
jgi:Ca2+-transporting ATPase